MDISIPKGEYIQMQDGLININEIRYMLKTEGLSYLSNLISKGKTTTVKGRIFIIKKQLEMCLKKEKSLPENAIN